MAPRNEHNSKIYCQNYETEERSPYLDLEIWGWMHYSGGVLNMAQFPRGEHIRKIDRKEYTLF